MGDIGVRGWLFRRYNKSNCIFGNVVFLAFVLAQCFDVLLTYIGVGVWGLEVEANPWIVWNMSIMGIGLGLMMGKLPSLVCGILLYKIRAHNAMMIVVATYWVFAIIPWAYLFLTFGALSG